MLAFAGRRMLQMIPVVVGVTFILFLLQVVIPGDPVRMLAGEKTLSPAVYQEIVHRNGLDRPIYVQYYRYMSRLIHGDLGESYQLRRPVTSILLEKFPNTVKLALLAIVIEGIVGVGAGLLAATKRRSFWDVLVTFSTSILIAVPVFWLGMALQVLFGIKFKEWGLPYLPVSGIDPPFGIWAHMVLPAITLAAVSTAYAARVARSQLLEVMGQEYMTVAAAKGLSPTQLALRHGMKNALIPVVTFLGLDLGAMIGGTILTETVFGWPGVGLQIYNAIMGRDWPIVFGGALIIVLLVMVINLVVDIAYAFLDPRIKLRVVAGRANG